MKKTLFVLIASFGFALPASALDIKAITSKPTADNPQYDNKEAWPDLVGDEYFLKETWPKGRLLIWAHAGGNPGRRSPKIDPMDPANWIDAATGKPAKSLPDMDTDIILPDSDTPYKVDTSGAQSYACRHVTIGRNVDFRVYGGGNFSVFGNLWIRNNGELNAWRTIIFTGDRHTFLRQAWPEDGKLKELHDERLILPFDPKLGTREQPWWDGSVGAYARHDKAEGKSTEVIGYANTGDEFGVLSGTFIVGRNSRFLSIGPAHVAIRKGAKVVMMDGAMLAHGINQFDKDCDLAAGAEITAGTPDRPIRRDAYLGVGYSNWMDLPFPDREKGKRAISSHGKFNAHFSGDLIGYPAPGSDARLVVCWQRTSMGAAGHWGPRNDAFFEMFTRLEPKITLWISDTAKVENTRFDDLHRGGIVVPTGVAEKWKNISFGDGCLSKDPKEIIREYKGKLHGNGLPAEQLTPEKKYTTM